MLRLADLLRLSTLSTAHGLLLLWGFLDPNNDTEPVFNILVTFRLFQTFVAQDTVSNQSNRMLFWTFGWCKLVTDTSALQGGLWMTGLVRILVLFIGPKVFQLLWLLPAPSSLTIPPWSALHGVWFW